ncbi:hypothetical protein BDA99DRAFT_562165 [Phascolomyces articulosus]|uniref:Cytidine deaminase n=1 Tax=Phascolomyces articulosus TaxID=60185 RepID=A0AAD5K8C5_9FUNG|nr:hypothetical protein BDA99DRAFT_562165 [Phascolomyces articulosus]
MTTEPHNKETAIKYLREAIKVTKCSRAMGRHPFAVILVDDATGEMLSQPINGGSVVHAEARIARTGESELATMATNSKKNPTLDLPCREVFKTGSRTVNVYGPYPELYEEFKVDHIVISGNPTNILIH